MKSFCPKNFWPTIFFSSKGQVSRAAREARNEGIFARGKEGGNIFARERSRGERGGDVDTLDTERVESKGGGGVDDRRPMMMRRGEREDICDVSTGTRGVTRRQISRGGRTSSKITGEPRPPDSTQASAQPLRRQD